MKLSWSHKLFLKINAQVGKNKWRDKFFYFCAHMLIYVLSALVLGWGIFVLSSEGLSQFVMFAKLMFSALVLAELLSYGLALVWKHPRPIVEFPDIKLLLHPIENWKSFPSDHTIVVTIFALIPILTGIHLAFAVVLIVCALLVMMGRVYVGVHYPRDIVGGLVVGIVFSICASWLVLHITQPIYTFLINLM